MLTHTDIQIKMDKITAVGASLQNEPVFVGPLSTDYEIDGLELSKAAQVLGISIDEIWKRIRNGLLIARTTKGQVLVYTDMTEILAHEGLPPPPTTTLVSASDVMNFGETQRSPQGTVRVLNVMTPAVTSASSSQELALLIDHLSLAKDENREILRLTQDSMARLTHMTDAILEMKDAVIATKEEQVAILKQRLSAQSADLIQALKDKEDLETLTQALQSK
jgi:hypothetical protein